MSAILVSFSRAGGRPPSDDELLEIRDDGTFRAHRSVGEARVGAFAGRVPTTTLRAVQRAAAACREAGALWLETPRDGATETIELGAEGEIMASFGSNARPSGPWGALARRVRLLLDRVTEHPVAAVELVADARGARVVPVGAQSLEVDPHTIELRLIRLDPAGLPIWRWGASAADFATIPPGWQRTGPGWSLELPFDQPVELAPGEWLQVWLALTFRTDVRRRGRLFVTLPGG